MNVSLNNTFALEANQIKSELFEFNDAANFKNVVSTYYGRIKRLLNKARPVLDIKFAELPSNNPQKLSLHITQVEVKNGELVFKTGLEKVRGKSVKGTLVKFLDEIKAAPARNLDFSAKHFD